MTSGVNAPPNPRLEEAIVEYLRSHPDFFNRHLELLDSLRVPHPCRPAVSLIERQLLRLREENTRYRERLRELVTVARENESLAQRMQALMVGLMEAADLHETMNALQAVLRDDFNADFTVLRLVAEPLVGEADRECMASWTFTDAGDLAILQGLLGTRKAFCGRLTREQARCLFDDPVPLGSVALIPLQGGGWWGLLAVGSRDQERFFPGMGTLFLTRIGELVSHALSPYLRPRSASNRS